MTKFPITVTLEEENIKKLGKNKSKTLNEILSKINNEEILEESIRIAKESLKDLEQKLQNVKNEKKNIIENLSEPMMVALIRSKRIIEMNPKRKELLDIHNKMFKDKYNIDLTIDEFKELLDRTRDDKSVLSITDGDLR